MLPCVRISAAGGDWSNSSWVPPNQYGRNIPDPNAEVGVHIKDKRSLVHADWRSGKHKNASWVPKNKCKCPHWQRDIIQSVTPMAVTSVMDSVPSEADSGYLCSTCRR